jgi:hypothetical protein
METNKYLIHYRPNGLVMLGNGDWEFIPDAKATPWVAFGTADKVHELCDENNVEYEILADDKRGLTVAVMFETNAEAIEFVAKLVA